MQTGTYSGSVEPTDISDSEDVRIASVGLAENTESPRVVEQEVVNEGSNPNLG